MMEIILLVHRVEWWFGVIGVVVGGVAILMLAVYLISKILRRRRG